MRGFFLEVAEEVAVGEVLLFRLALAVGGEDFLALAADALALAWEEDLFASVVLVVVGFAAVTVTVVLVRLNTVLAAMRRLRECTGVGGTAGTIPAPGLATLLLVGAGAASAEAAVAVLVVTATGAAGEWVAGGGGGLVASSAG